MKQEIDPSHTPRRIWKLTNDCSMRQIHRVKLSLLASPIRVGGGGRQDSGSADFSDQLLNGAYKRHLLRLTNKEQSHLHNQPIGPRPTTHAVYDVCQEK